MQQVLSHIGVAAVAIVATLLLARGCQEPKVITEIECYTDTLTVSDTIEILRYKTVKDTIERIVYIDTTEVKNEPDLELMSYEEHYVDSSYSVHGNIFYTGSIIRHDQMFVQNKEQIQFIPRVRTVFNTRDNIIYKTEQPLLYVGLYSSFDLHIPVQAGISVTYADKRNRLYTLGKDLVSTRGWTFDIKAPVLWSKK